MECYYHPERDGTDTCAICGKSICKECGLEIAGKTYCKECLEKIVGLGIANTGEPAPQAAPVEEPVKAEPARLEKQPVDESIYQPQAEEAYVPQEEVAPSPEIKQIQDDSPYKVRDNIEYAGGMESSYIEEKEAIPQVEEIPQNEVKIEEIPSESSQDFIYPDHSYEPQTTSARAELEDKYEKYLDDLYFDDNVPLNEQLAKDEEQFGSLTRKPYQARSEESTLKEQSGAPRNETPEEMEARIRAEILAEKDGGRIKDRNIHKLNYQEEKEPMSIVDILLTIILIIVILVVIYYLIYVFILNASYPTFMDAIYALSNPQNVINNILSPQ